MTTIATKALRSYSLINTPFKLLGAIGAMAVVESMLKHDHYVPLTKWVREQEFYRKCAMVELAFSLGWLANDAAYEAAEEAEAWRRAGEDGPPDSYYDTAGDGPAELAHRQAEAQKLK